MANIKFTVKDQMVELWRDGVFVAEIHPHKDGVRLVSKYMDGVEQEPGYPPAVVVRLSDAG